MIEREIQEEFKNFTKDLEKKWFSKSEEMKDAFKTIDKIYDFKYEYKWEGEIIKEASD